VRQAERVLFHGGFNDKSALALPVLEQMERDQPIYGLSYRRTANPETPGKFAFAHELIARLEDSFENQVAQLFENQI
jgi:hypothetical protein